MKNLRIFFTIILFSAEYIWAQAYGLTERVPNNSLLIESNNIPAEYELQRAFPAIKFSSPVFLGNAADGGDRIFVLETEGIISVFANNDGVEQTGTFLNIANRVTSGGERGLLGLAFHPDYKNSNKFYVYYTTGNLISRISEFKVSANPDVADESSERILLEVEQPASNHNGGMIAFGPDGNLYIALGDGGGGGDTYHNGQNKATLLGAILRINIDSTQNELQYKVPADNPFVNDINARPEIWAYGLRNPWRFSFDRQTGDLWCGDVGQGTWEEVDIIKKGGNYGWPIMEGFHCYGGSGCNTAGLDLPVAEYNHSDGYSITGGYVYRGTKMPELAGTYIYGDYGTRLIWGLKYENNQVTSNELLTQSPGTISSFGEDEAGEIYVVSYSNGNIYRIIKKEGTGIEKVIPDSISKSGLYSEIIQKTISPGLIPYDLNSPLWSNGAVKQRLFALPDTSKITFKMDSSWSFPENTVIVKNFSLDLEVGNSDSRKLVETRFLVKRSEDEGWDGYSYIWNDEQTEATLLEDNATKSFEISGPDGNYNYDYYFPSRNECLKCHTPAAGYVLGPRTAQLNRTYTYENGVTDNQLRSFNHIRLFDEDIGEDYGNFPMLTKPGDLSQSLQDRARSYLDANCGSCHRPGGTGFVDMDLTYLPALESTNLIDIDPTQGNLGIDGAKRIKPGEPESSVLYLRMLATDINRMPPLAVNVVDTFATHLIYNWIKSLGPTSVHNDNIIVPRDFSVSAYPNPFNPQLNIEYNLPENAHVEIIVYDILGHKIRTLISGIKEAGLHKIKWDGKNSSGVDSPSAVYFYKITALAQTRRFEKTQKIILLK